MLNELLTKQNFTTILQHFQIKIKIYKLHSCVK